VRLTRSESISGYISIIEGRIKALSRAHALLSSSRWQGADLDTLAHEELAPYRSTHADRLSIFGPKVTLEPTKAQTLALALHELATNAAKYGALSSAAGKLALSWEAEEDALTLHWQETAGPATRAPTVTGFGTQIITGSIERQLGGKTRFEWLPSGLRCTLTIPRGERMDGEAPAQAPAAAPKAPLPARRIMVVEDEALVALVLADQLGELGLSVIGPCSSVAEAKAIAENGEFEAAILDVNLGGELVYPVAELLSARGIPFVFVTGYGRESIDRRFAEAPVLEKPVEMESLEHLFGEDTSERRMARIA
jgi:two-component sensor histidine kinase/CheY-like chemotaxis protein